MAGNIILNNISNLQDTTTAQTYLNQNNSTITAAVFDTLSRAGVAPNQMSSTLDMNSNPIINLPAPATLNSPVRLQDISSTSVGINTLSGSNTYTGSNTFIGNTQFSNSVPIKGPDPWVDVKAFGALGNSTGDDTGAINAAIAFLVANAPFGTGTVYFPPGNYLISSTITIPGSISLRGSGKGSSSLNAISPSIDLLYINGSFVNIEDLGLYGYYNVGAAQYQPATSGWAVNANNTNNSCCWRNLLISGTYNGIFMGGTNGFLEYVRIENIYGPYGVSTNGGGGFIGNNQFDNLSYGVSNNSASRYTSWVATTNFNVNDICSNNGYLFGCTASGTTANSGGPSVSSFGTPITDGTCTWQTLCNSSYTKITLNQGGSIIQNNDISGPCIVGVLLNSSQGALVSYNNFGEVIGIGLKALGDCGGYLVSNNSFANIYGNPSIGQHGVLDETDFLTIGNSIVENTFGGIGGPAIATNSNFTTIRGNFVANNYSEQISGGPAIVLGASSSYFIVKENLVYSIAGYSSILVQAGASNYYIISDNIVTGIPVTDGGTGTTKSVTSNF